MARKYWIVLSFILASVMVPSLSNAAICNLTGVVVRVTAYDDALAATNFIYFRTSSLAPYYYYVTTTDDDMISNAIAYMNSGRTATIQGNTGVAACPAVPAAGGAASIGTLNFIFNP